MAADVALLDLRMRRRALMGYAIGMVVYALVIVALYPSFKNDASLDELTKNSPTIAALFGATGSLTTSSGWLNANLYSNFVPLVVLLLTIGYGASCIAGQSEDGTLGLITTLPISRGQIAMQKFTAMSLQAAAISIVTAVCVVAGRGFDLTIDIPNLIGITAGVLLLGIDFGVLAILIGAATGSRGSALGITSSIAAASYLVSSLAPVVRWVRPARFGSLFFYAVGDGQLVHGLTVANAAALVGTAVLLLLALPPTFARLDVR
jgi:beta-exotoxin I transport system permease protein